jgi:hypothetical protein
MPIQPNALTKKLNVLAWRLLQEFSVKYENGHSRSGSNIRLTLI